MRTYVVQALALLLVAVAGGVDLWHSGTLTLRPVLPNGRTGVAEPRETRSAQATLVSFRATIAPLFRTHCAECHLGGNGSGGLQLDTYRDLIQGGSLVPGPIFQAGDHTKSILWQIIQPDGGWPAGNRMPLDGRYLAADQIQAIARWIDQGAGNN